MTNPEVFLCHASEDQALARRIADEFMTNGIKTFLDEWEIRSGDSLVRKINQGLGTCTHFVVLLTPTSIEKPWVQAEMDAGLVQKINGKCRFIALRHELEAERLPPLLSPYLAPEIADFEEDIRKVIGDIYGVSRKPPLGPTPDFAVSPLEDSGLSVTAARIVEKMVRESVRGMSMDPQLQTQELFESMELSVNELDDAIRELDEASYITKVASCNSRFGVHAIAPSRLLFVEFDSHFMDWNPEEDALKIAFFLVNSEEGSATSQALQDQFQWETRRLNPALSYLIVDDIVRDHAAMGIEFVTYCVTVTSKTRRFVRENS